MIRFSHTLFALPFALLAAAMAWATNAARRRRLPLAGLAGHPGLHGHRPQRRHGLQSPGRPAAGRLNPRTQHAALAHGALSVGGRGGVYGRSAAAGLRGRHALVPAAQPHPAGRLACRVLVFLFGYSYAKRFTLLSHFWLGAALMLAPAGRLGGHPRRNWPGRRWCWPAAVLLWVAGFDMIYACQDVRLRRPMRLRSVPARLGVAAALRLAALCHLGMVVLLAALPLVYPGFGQLYLAGVAAIAVLLVYEHWLVRPDDLTRVNRAFFHVNAVVSVGLLAVGALGPAADEH